MMRITEIMYRISCIVCTQQKHHRSRESDMWAQLLVYLIHIITTDNQRIIYKQINNQKKKCIYLHSLFMDCSMYRFYMVKRILEGQPIDHSICRCVICNNRTVVANQQVHILYTIVWTEQHHITKRSVLYERLLYCIYDSELNDFAHM